MSVQRPSGRALVVVQRLIHEQLERALSCESLLRAGCGVDAVHDYRVAQRRTRVLLREYGDLLPDEARGLRRNLRWLAKVTGPVRDLDMLIAGISGRAARARERCREGVGAMVDALSSERDGAASRLVARLDSERHAATVESWRTLARGDAVRPGDADVEAFVLVTGHRLHERQERLALVVGTQGDESDDSALHRVRIAAKSVRYLLEFLESVRPSRDTAAALRALRAIQDRLGAFQDDVVHAAMLGERIEAGAFPEPECARAEAAIIARRIDRARPVVRQTLRRIDAPAQRARLQRATRHR